MCWCFRKFMWCFFFSHFKGTQRTLESSSAMLCSVLFCSVLRRLRDGTSKITVLRRKVNPLCYDSTMSSGGTTEHVSEIVLCTLIIIFFKEINIFPRIRYIIINVMSVITRNISNLECDMNITHNIASMITITICFCCERSQYSRSSFPHPLHAGDLRGVSQAG